MELSFHLNDIENAAGKMLELLSKQPGRVLALHGQMGAGKTTLVAAMVKVLGCKQHASSPTFSIINQYTDWQEKPVYHMDWYRLGDEEEAVQAGVEDPMFSGHWCFIEWPEKAINLLPEDATHLFIGVESADMRMISFAG